MASDWEAGVNFPDLIQERFDKAQAAVKRHRLGAVLCFNFDNIRYVTATHIGEWCRDKMNRYALCPREGKAYLFDPAVPAKRITCPWMEDRMEPLSETIMEAGLDWSNLSILLHRPRLLMKTVSAARKDITPD